MFFMFWEEIMQIELSIQNSKHMAQFCTVNTLSIKKIHDIQKNDPSTFSEVKKDRYTAL